MPLVSYLDDMSITFKLTPAAGAFQPLCFAVRRCACMTMESAASGLSRVPHVRHLRPRPQATDRPPG